MVCEELYQNTLKEPYLYLKKNKRNKKKPNEVNSAVSFSIWNTF